MVVKSGFRDWDEKLFSSLRKIFGIMVVGEDSDDMEGHKVAESGITVGGRDLSVVVFYSLVRVMFVISFVELFLSLFIWKYTSRYIPDYIAWTFSSYITLKIFL